MERNDLSRGTLVRITADHIHGFTGYLGKVLDPEFGNDQARILVYKIGDLHDDGRTKTTVIASRWDDLELVSGKEFPPAAPSPTAQQIDFATAVSYVQLSEGAISEGEMVTVNDTVASTGKAFRCKVDLTPYSHLFCWRDKGGKAQWFLEYGPKAKQ